jgi:predicted nucleic acid-binding protein
LAESQATEEINFVIDATREVTRNRSLREGDRAAVQQLQEQAKLDPGESEAIVLALDVKADLRHD